MKYTKEQIDKMSDYEINLAVAEKTLADDVWQSAFGKTFIRDDIFNPCENWNDVMPIAVNHSIDLAIGNMTVRASLDIYLDVYNDSTNKNPRRAICEVFLMMDV